MTNTNDPAYVSDDTGVVLGTLITDQPLESLAAAAYDDVMVDGCVRYFQRRRPKSRWRSARAQSQLHVAPHGRGNYGDSGG